MPEGKFLLRWGMQKGYAVLTKSVNPARIRENIDLFGFEIGAGDMKAVDACDKNAAVAWTAQGMNPMDVDVPLAA